MRAGDLPVHGVSQPRIRRLPGFEGIAPVSVRAPGGGRPAQSRTVRSPGSPYARRAPAAAVSRRAVMTSVPSSIW